MARLATVGADGAPHLVPITFAVHGDTILTAVDGKPKSTMRLRRLANIATNPNVSVLVDHYDDDWQTLWWARADGVARLVDTASERREAVRLLTGRYEQYVATPPPGPVVAIDVGRWSGWTAAAQR